MGTFLFVKQRLCHVGLTLSVMKPDLYFNREWKYTYKKKIGLIIFELK